MTRIARASLALTALLTACSPALAQQRKPADPLAPAAPTEAAAPYEPELTRLAEIMGALTYLRDLCGADDGAKWRAQMARLLEAEASSQARRDRLAGAYNRGFRGFETTYHACTPNAEIAIQRYLDEGGKIARDVGARFGGG